MRFVITPVISHVSVNLRRRVFRHVTLRAEIRVTRIRKSVMKPVIVLRSSARPTIPVQSGSFVLLRVCRMLQRYAAERLAPIRPHAVTVAGVLTGRVMVNPADAITWPHSQFRRSNTV